MPEALSVSIIDNVVVKLEGTVSTDTTIQGTVGMEIVNDVVNMAITAATTVPVSIEDVVKTRTELVGPLEIDTANPLNVVLPTDYTFNSMIAFAADQNLKTTSLVSLAENQSLKVLFDLPETFNVKAEISEVKIVVDELPEVKIASDTPLQTRIMEEVDVHLVNDRLDVVAHLDFPDSHRTDVAFMPDTKVKLDSSSADPIKIELTSPIPKEGKFGMESILFVLFQDVSTGRKFSKIEYFGTEKTLGDLADWIECQRIAAEKKDNVKVAIIDYRLTQRPKKESECNG